MAAAVLALVGMSACTHSGEPSGGIPSPAGGTRLVVAQRSADRIAVTVAGGCPMTLGRAGDVANDATGLGHHLVPVGQRPRAGLVCEYHEGQGFGSASVRLTSSVRLNAGDAARLASVIGRISLTRPRGEQGCPAALFGTDSVIAFSYPGDRSVDLWYYTSGCQTLDNGHTRAYQSGNPSFYSAFESAYAAATRH